MYILPDIKQFIHRNIRHMNPWLAAIFLLLVPVFAEAQQPKYTEEITVVATYKPEIPDAFKINQNPVNTDTSTTVPVMNYNIRPTPAAIRLQIEPLPSTKLVAEPISKLYRNYLKGGFGNYSTLYGELYAASLRSKKGMFGVRAKHLSSAGTIKGFGPPANSHQLAEIDGERYLKNHVLDAKAYINRDVVHYYGVADTTLDRLNIKKDDLKQRYALAGGDVSLTSSYSTNNKLNHAFSLGYYYMDDLYQSTEHNVHFNGSANKAYDLFNLKEKQTLGLVTDLQFYNQVSGVSAKQNSVVVLLKPFMAMKYNEYSFKAGFNIYFQGDTVTKGHVYPFLEARLEAIPNALQIYAGLDGSMKRNTLKDIVTENPFVKDGSYYQYVNEKFRVYGGFSSNISKSFNFNGSISSSTIENNPFFIGEYSVLHNTFKVIYDDISVMKLKAELEFVKSGKMNLSISGNYNKYYKLLYEEHPWYKPDFVIGFNGRYNIQDKIIVKLQADYNGPVWAYEEQDPMLSSVTPAEKINGWFDGSLGLEYKFNKALSFWLNFSNFTNNRYWIWYNYPSYRFNVTGGASFSF
jgi:hypothetical protein